MRNLKIIRKSSSFLNIKNISKAVFCSGAESFPLFCIYEDRKVPTLLNIKPNFIENEVKVLCEDEVLRDVFKMEFVGLSGLLFMASKRGGFLQYSVERGEVEELFETESGILDFSVTPDSRMVVLVTEDLKIIQLALPHLEMISQIVLIEKPCHELEKDVKITWRQDCKYFIVNYYDHGTGLRKLKSFDETGILFSTSEDENCLITKRALLSPQPSGGLIASMKKKDDKNEIVIFFEQNGLTRSEFNPFEFHNSKEEPMEIYDIFWNPSSEILAIRKENSVELWIRSNYHWMCKCKLTLDGIVKSKIIFAGWDTELHYRLNIVFESGNFSSYDFKFDYDREFTGGSAIVGSINGNFLYYTPFHYNCAPPPFGFSKETVSSQIQEVILAKFFNGALCISEGELTALKSKGLGLNLFKSSKLPEQFSGAYNWIWPNEKTLCSLKDGIIHTIQDFEISSENSQISQFKPLDQDGHFISIFNIGSEFGQSDKILAEKSDGSIYSIDLKNYTFEFLFKIPSNISQFSLKHFYQEKPLLVLLDLQTQKLYGYWNKSFRKIINDVTSFEIKSSSLLATSMQGNLEIYETEDLKEFIENSSTAPKSYTRRLEKGSRIVTICQNRNHEPSLVLQILPRGNIETICPRPLIISSLKCQLREEKVNFNSILDAMKRHRIDFNIIFEQFESIENDGGKSVKNQLREMLNNTDDSNVLVLLVTEINEKNEKHLKNISTILGEMINDEKVEDRKKMEFPYLAAMAKLNLHESVFNSSLISPDNDQRDDVKKRIKFLSFYCENSELIFESAIGTYDLNLTSIVADCLNKDPKEYLPILNELREMNPQRRSFTIDNKLKRFPKALTHLIQDSDSKSEEIIKYVERHRLYKEALEFLGGDSKWERSPEEVKELSKEINTSFGKYLEGQGKLKEATVFYDRGGNWEEAKDAAVKGGCWEEAIRFALKLKLNQNQISLFYKKLLSVLEGKEQFEICGNICEIYTKEYKEAFHYFLKARQFIKARLIISQNEELFAGLNFDELLIARILENSKALEELLSKLHTDVDHYVKRLGIVRDLKAKALENGEGEENFSDNESVSSFRSSQISSSIGTGKTFRSSKNRRKMERKAFSLKEGSTLEDIGIIAHLWETFYRIQNENKREMSIAVEALWRFNCHLEAARLSASFDSLLLLVDKSLNSIWIPTLSNPALETKYRIPPPNWTTNWEKMLI